MANAVKSFRDLEVYQVSCDLVEAIYRVTKRFPKDELYGLTNQIRRAAVSVPTNISEGAGRIGAVEYRHFVSIALGSSAEVRTLIELARRLEYLTDEEAARLDREVTRVESMAWKLHQGLAPARR